MTKCKARTTTGGECKNKAIKNKKYCYVHRKSEVLVKNLKRESTQFENEDEKRFTKEQEQEEEEEEEGEGDQEQEDQGEEEEEEAQEEEEQEEQEEEQEQEPKKKKQIKNKKLKLKTKVKSMQTPHPPYPVSFYNQYEPEQISNENLNVIRFAKGEYEVGVLILTEKHDVKKGEKITSQGSATKIYTDASWSSKGDRFDIPNELYTIQNLFEDVKKSKLAHEMKLEKENVEWHFFNDSAEKLNFDSTIGPSGSREKRFYLIPILKDDTAIKKQAKPRFYITMGPPASGKTGAWVKAQEIIDKEENVKTSEVKGRNVLQIIVDDFVSSDPSYLAIAREIANGIALAEKNKETLDILCKIGFQVYRQYRSALQGGEDLSNLLYIHATNATPLRKKNWDVVWETTGTAGPTYSWLKKVVANVKQCHYSINLVYPLVQVDNLVARSIARAKEEGRLPCAAAIRENYTLSLKALTENVLGTDKDLFDRIFVFNNDRDGVPNVLVLYCDVLKCEQIDKVALESFKIL